MGDGRFQGSEDHLAGGGVQEQLRAHHSLAGFPQRSIAGVKGEVQVNITACVFEFVYRLVAFLALINYEKVI